MTFLCMHISISAPMRNMMSPDPTTGNHPSSSSSSSDDDPQMARIQRALLRWRDCWTEACRQTPSETLSRIGLFRNGHKYFLVAQLLISKHDKIDAAFLLQPGCEEKLERLQHLA